MLWRIRSFVYQHNINKERERKKDENKRRKEEKVENETKEEKICKNEKMGNVC